MRFEAPRGTHDILPSEQAVWRRMMGEAERLCALYGYGRVQTPVFEDTELFVRTSGAGSDIVRKEMYTFEDLGGRSLTLRPEGTAPICRAYLEHGLHREPQPVKLYTIASMYRYDRPQRGRYREHWQLSVEAIGSDDPAIDAEIIELYAALLRGLGISDYVLKLNSIGDAVCRPRYLEQLRAWLSEHDSDVDDDVRQTAKANPLRVLDDLHKRPAGVREILAAAPKIGDGLCEPCRAHFESVKSYLGLYGVDFELEPTLVRGLDYYTRTTWQFEGPESGAQSVLSGGGRYDGLIEEIGGAHTPGVGFGAGFERLSIALEHADRARADPVRLDVFFVCDSRELRFDVLRAMQRLRAAGISCDTDYAGRSLNGQIKFATRLKPRVTAVVSSLSAEIRRQGERDFNLPITEPDFVERIQRALA